MEMIRSRRLVAFSLSVAIVVVPRLAVHASPSGDSNAQDQAAVLGVTQEYADAWLSNDAARVMRTLTPDIVLLPSGMTEIRGHDAAKAFWFPASGAATTIDAMTQTVDEVLLASDLAVVRGRGTLTFTTGAGTTAQTRSQASWFVNVLRREQDGSWKIARRMWSDVRR